MVGVCKGVDDVWRCRWTVLIQSGWCSSRLSFAIGVVGCWRGMDGRCVDRL